MKKLMIFIVLVSVVGSMYAQSPTYVRGKQLKSISKEFVNEEHTLTAMVVNTANMQAEVDQSSSKELKEMLLKDLKELGFNIIEGDMNSEPDKKTIIVTMNLTGTGKKSKSAYLVEVRDYTGMMPTSEDQTYYRGKTVKTYEDVIEMIKEDME